MSLIPDVSSIVGGAVQSVATAYFGSRLWKTKHAILNSNNKAIVGSAAIMSVDVLRERTVTSHPIESNSYIQDHIFTLPLQLRVELLVPESLYTIGGIYDALIAAYTDVTSTYSVYSDNVVYSDLVIVKMPQKKTTDKIDVIQVTLEFSEFIYVATKKSTIGNTSVAKNADVKNNGLVQSGSVPSATAASMELQRQG